MSFHREESELLTNRRYTLELGLQKCMEFDKGRIALVKNFKAVIGF